MSTPSKRLPLTKRNADRYFRQREKDYLQRGYSPQGAEMEAEADLTVLRLLRQRKPYKRGWMRPQIKTSNWM